MMAGRAVQEITSVSNIDGQTKYSAIQVTTALSIAVGSWQVSTVNVIRSRNKRALNHRGTDDRRIFQRNLIFREGFHSNRK